MQPQPGSSPERTEELRDDLVKALKAMGVTSFALAFTDPDTPNWTWASGNNDLEALGMARLMAADIERLAAKG